MINKKSNYQAYLETVHARHTIPNDILINVVKEATDKDIQKKKRIISGEVNEVYDITLSSGKSVIARISRSERDIFQSEHWAIEHVKKVGVPVPEVLFIKNIILDGKNASICIQEKISGEPLERGTIDYHTLDKEILRSLLHQVGNLLSRIHSIPVSGFGRIDAQGNAKIKTFQEYMSEHIDQYDIFSPIFTQTGMTTDTIQKIFTILQEKAQNAPTISPVLNHNDFAPKHWMIENDNIVGILDWGAVGGHSPIHDFVTVSYWYPNIPLEWIKDGYENKKIFDETFDDTLRWLQLNNALGAVWWYHEQGYKEGIMQARGKIEKLVRYFS